MPNSSGNLRSLPSVDRVLRDLGELSIPRPLATSIIREELSRLRDALRAGETGDPGDPGGPGALLPTIRQSIARRTAGRLTPVINGTGILIHTNLGRAPMGRAVAAAVAAAATQYTNLEFDLTTGERGHRGEYVEHALAALCQAERATVVNNCAAGLILILRHFTAGPDRKAVIISRGELVQIGGGFRVPEILEASGAVLREVGTTNQTTLDDYRRAIDGSSAMILRVHRSSFFMDGFVASPAPPDLAGLAHSAGLPFVEDFGTGATFDTTTIGDGVEREPTPAELLAGGADLVCFSGDKLLGGPQAGIIAGRKALVAALKHEPFFRALRCDKLVFAALQATVDLLLDQRLEALPLRSMMQLSTSALRVRGDRIVSAVDSRNVRAAVIGSVAQVGGGTMPRTKIDSVAIELTSAAASPQQLADRLRRQPTPVIAYVAMGTCRIDLRTVFPEQDESLIHAVNAAGTVE